MGCCVDYGHLAALDVSLLEALDVLLAVALLEALVVMADVCWQWRCLELGLWSWLC